MRTRHPSLEPYPSSENPIHGDYYRCCASNKQNDSNIRIKNTCQRMTTKHSPKSFNPKIFSSLYTKSQNIHLPISVSRDIIESRLPCTQEDLYFCTYVDKGASGKN